MFVAFALGWLALLAAILTTVYLIFKRRILHR